jgi:hypothetical protein
MLTGVNRAWPFTAATSNGASTGTLFRVNTSETGIGTVNGLFCRNCHPAMNNTAASPPAYTNSLHKFANTSSHTGTNGFPSCVNCHIRVPHGGKVSRLILTPNAPARYKTGTQTPTMIGFTKGSRTSYSSNAGWDSNCGTHGNTGGETW